MSIRVIAPDGTDQSFPDPESLRRAIREGNVARGSLVYHRDREKWIPADQHPALEGAFSEDQSSIDPSAEDAREDEQTEVPATLQSSGDDTTSSTESSESGPSSRVTTISWLVIIISAGYHIHLQNIANPVSPSGLGRITGTFVGVVLAMFVLPGILLVWSSKTRRYLVPAAAVIAILFGLGEYSQQQESQQLARTELDRFEHLGDSVLSFMSVEDTAINTDTVPNKGEGRPDGAIPLNQTEEPSDANVQVDTAKDFPPRGTSIESRMLWVLRKTTEEYIAVVTKQVSSQNLESPPEGFVNNIDALANPSHYPNVSNYLDRHERFIEWGDRRLPVIADSILRVYYDQARLPESYWDSVKEGLDKGLENSFYGETSTWGTMKNFVATANDLWTYLIEIEEHTRYDSTRGVIRFRHPSHQRRARKLALRVDSLRNALLTARARFRNRLSGMIDTMRAFVEGQR